MEELIIRPMNEQDLNLVLATWLNSYFHSSYFARTLRKETFYYYHEKAIRRILLRSQTKAMMAADAGDPYVVFGYLIYEDHSSDSVLHFAYVKKELRGMGVMRMLLDQSNLDMRLPLEYTHQVRAYDHDSASRGEKHWKRHWIFEKFPDLIHNPYKL